MMSVVQRRIILIGGIGVTVLAITVAVLGHRSDRFRFLGGAEHISDTETRAGDVESTYEIQRPLGFVSAQARKELGSNGFTAPSRANGFGFSMIRFRADGSADTYVELDPGRPLGGDSEGDKGWHFSDGDASWTTVLIRHHDPTRYRIQSIHWHF